MRVSTLGTDWLVARHRPFGAWAWAVAAGSAAVYFAATLIPAHPDRLGAYIPALVLGATATWGAVAPIVTLRLDRAAGEAVVTHHGLLGTRSRTGTLAAVTGIAVERIPGRKPFAFRLVLSLRDGQRWVVVEGGLSRLWRVCQDACQFVGLPQPQEPLPWPTDLSSSGQPPAASRDRPK